MVSVPFHLGICTIGSLLCVGTRRTFPRILTCLLSLHPSFLSFPFLSSLLLLHHLSSELVRVKGRRLFKGPFERDRGCTVLSLAVPSRGYTLFSFDTNYADVHNSDGRHDTTKVYFHNAITGNSAYLARAVRR